VRGGVELAERLGLDPVVLAGASAVLDSRGVGTVVISAGPGRDRDRRQSNEQEHAHHD
jgi:hypothetical protein